MFFRQTHCLVEILRRPRDVVITIISRLRAGWKTLRSGTGVTITGGVKETGEVEKRLERDALYAASLVSRIVEDTFPGRKVAVQARLKGNPQPALNFLKQQFLKPGNDN
jgi:hypothetical protein